MATSIYRDCNWPLDVLHIIKIEKNLESPNTGVSEAHALVMLRNEAKKQYYFPLQRYRGSGILLLMLYMVL